MASVIGTKISETSYSVATALIQNWAQAGESRAVYAINVFSNMEAHDNLVFRGILNQAEIIRDGHSGLHLTAGDVHDLVNKVDSYFYQINELKRLGNNARQEYEEKYTSEQNYRRLIEIYQTAIAKVK